MKRLTIPALIWKVEEMTCFWVMPNFFYFYKYLSPTKIALVGSGFEFFAGVVRFLFDFCLISIILVLFLD